MRQIVVALALSCIFVFSGSGVSVAQGWPPWADDVFSNRGWGDERQHRWEQLQRPPPVERQQKQRASGDDLRDGGPRPEIAPKVPPVVEFRHDFSANSIVIDTGGRKLFYVLGDDRAYAYPISVGREGFNWTGTETVARKQAWPDWHPPAEMRERDPSLPEKMTGGLKNPLGAMALYLGNSLYRIHGTNDSKSIGRAASSGCFRMLNSAVLHLASLAEIGTTVTVVASLPARQEVSRAPESLQASQPRPDISPQGPPPATSDGPDRAPDYRALRDYTLRRQ